MSFSQVSLEDKFRIFLGNLDQENMQRYSGGLCNAFAFLNFRAVYYDLQDKNLERMAKIMTQDVKVLAENYKDYKSNRATLIKTGKIAGEKYHKIQALNTEIDKLYKSLILLRKEKNAIDSGQVLYNKKLVADIAAMEGELKKLREMREEQVKAVLEKIYSAEQWKKIQDAEDLYVYINMLLAAFDPYSDFQFRVSGKPVNQNNFIEMLQLFPVDVSSVHEDKAEKSPRVFTLNGKEHSPSSLDSVATRLLLTALYPYKNNQSSSFVTSSTLFSPKITQPSFPRIKQVFEIAFNFTKEELVAFFDNKYNSNTICEGDLIRLACCNHAIFLTYRKGRFELYDPGLINLPDNTAETLVSTLEDRFFKMHYITETTIIPMAITIFEKEKIDKVIERPERATMVKSIIDKRPEKNLNKLAWDETTAVWIAAKYDHMDTIKILAEEKADLNLQRYTRSTPALIAAQLGNANTIKTLAEQKADLTLLDGNKNGSMIASTAANYGHANVIPVLLEEKVDLSFPDINGATPAFWAAQEGHANVIQALAKAKADLNYPTIKNITPTMIAAQQGHADVIKALAKAKVDVNATYGSTRTPAILAARNGHTNVIKVLAECKVNLSLPNEVGETPASMAAKHGKTEVVALLREIEEQNKLSRKLG